MQLNHIYFGGNLTAQPELKALPNGTKVTQFSIASNRTWKDANGQEQSAVEYGNCVLFGKQAETFCKYAVKGQAFLIEGRIQTRNLDKDGVKHYRTEIIVDRFHFGSKPQGNNVGGYSQAPAGDDWGDAPAVQTGGYNGAIADGSINPDDIPF